MVLSRHEESTRTPVIQPELLVKWSAGRRAAQAWAKNRGCDMNGRMLTDVAAEAKQRDMDEMADDITDLFQRTDIIKDVLKRKH